MILVATCKTVEKCLFKSSGGLMTVAMAESELKKDDFEFSDT